MAQERDPYSVLGVSPGATEADIRAAYIARSRVIHPDRFSQTEQHAEWKKANEMLAELNEAYGKLKNPDRRRTYDRASPTNPTSKSSTGPTVRPRAASHPKSAALPGDSNGYYSYWDLPTSTKEKLRGRQSGRNPDQLRASLDLIGWNIAFIAILLCWFWYLFYAATHSPKWDGQAMFWYAAITILVGGMIGANVVTLTRWWTSVLTPALYVTPLYFIKTDYDVVSFWPFWSLKDLAVTHKYNNGTYQNSLVVLKFDGREETLTLSSESQVESLVARLREYDERIRKALRSENDDYFVKHDDFSGISTLHSPLANGKLVSHLPITHRYAVYAGSIAVCIASLLVAAIVNTRAANRPWVRHSLPTTAMPATDHSISHSQATAPTIPIYIPKAENSRVVEQPPVPPQPQPPNGSVKLFTSAACVAPFEIRSAAGGQYLVKLVNSTSKADVLIVFVHGGKPVEIEVPLGVYEVRYTTGDVWYGYEYLFGPGAVYSKADTSFDFHVVGNEVRGYTITLYKVAHGNLHTTEISPTEF